VSNKILTKRLSPKTLFLFGSAWAYLYFAWLRLEKLDMHISIEAPVEILDAGKSRRPPPAATAFTD
jgi:hypothetical protein